MGQAEIDTDVLVVGAGLAGLMAARTLRKQGVRVVVVDKGRSVGGRLATRRIGPGRADHGAQFFTVRSPEFRAWVEQWLSEEVVYRWSNGWSDGSLAPVTFKGHPRYAVYGGMNALTKYLAQGLDTRLNVRLEAVTATESGWLSRNAGGQTFTSQGLLLTPPVPQSLALLDTGHARLSTGDRAALDRIEYVPCLAGLFWLDGLVHLPEPGAIQHSSAPISWIASNRRKGISPEATIITIHAGPEYSRQLWEASEAEALAALQAGLQPYLAPGTNLVEAQLKRWRYAMCTTSHPERCLVAEGLPPLAFAGDGFSGSGVEGATLSGVAAGQSLAARW